MATETNLNLLVSNVVSENRYKHCRLCLRDIQETYVRFEDSVSLETDESFQPLSEVLTTLLGPEICEEIPGVDAVCTDCVDMALVSSRFLKKCRNSTQWLHIIFDRLAEKLNADVDTSKDHLYVTVNPDDTNVVLVNNKKKAKVKHSVDKAQCQECGEKFNEFIELRVHSTVEHGTVACQICQTFLNESDTEMHEKTCQNFKCPECLRSKDSAESLREHQKKFHEVYVCKECGKLCKGLDNLQAHEVKHVSKSECPKCGKTYLTRDCFTKHVKLCLEDRIDRHPYRAKIEKTYSCAKCSKKYSTPGGLRVHERFSHGNAKHHVCEICGKQFTAPSYLKTHMLRHTGEKNFKCNVCGNSFVSKEALLYHFRRHTGERPYSCKLCSERFVNASARAEHIKFKHDEPKLTCEFCSRKFYTASFLRQHITRHQDPSSKLYIGRSMIPPNMPGEQNKRYRLESM